MQNDALVTIVAISYNQEKYVLDALNSIKNQTYKNIQLIIADDGSTDNTKALISDWVANNWQSAIFLNHLNNQGITKNLNSALPYIKGEFYQFLGCEDNLLPQKIELQVALLTENPSYSIVYSDMYRMDANGIVEELTQFQSKKYNIPYSGNIYAQLLERCFISTPTALQRTEVLFDLGGDNERLEINDYDYWLRASTKYLFLYHPDVTVFYRVLTSSVSNRKGIFVFKNRFLLYYLNYNNDKKYRHIFNEKLLFSLKNLFTLKYKFCYKYALRAFIKTRKIEFIKYFIASTFFIATNNTD